MAEPTINKENLVRLGVYIKNNCSKENFDMASIKSITPPVGCPLVHLLGAMPEILEKRDEEGKLIYMNEDNTFPRFTRISKDFLGIDMMSEDYEKVFGWKWAQEDNSVDGFLKRLRDYIKSKS